MVFDDGKGAAAIGLSVNRVEPGSEQARQVTTCPDKAFVDHDGCTSTRLPDGSRLMLFRGYEYPDRRVDTKWWNAELVTPKGQHVSLSEWNAPAQKDAPVSRPQPPLSEAQMKKVVTAGVWRRVVDAMPESPKPSVTSEAPPQGVLNRFGRRHAGLAAARRADRDRQGRRGRLRLPRRRRRRGREPRPDQRAARHVGRG